MQIFSSFFLLPVNRLTVLAHLAPVLGFVYRKHGHLIWLLEGDGGVAVPLGVFKKRDVVAMRDTVYWVWR